MKKALLFVFALASTSTAFATSGHTGFCRYGEECGGIIADNLRDAQRICSRMPFEKIPQRVYQEQADGSAIFVGYVCVAPPSFQ